MSKKQSNVSVAVRIRPRNEKESLSDMPVMFSPDKHNKDVQELNETGQVVKSWSYDHVFGPECTNLYIFNMMASSLIDAAIEGYNTVLFMYGQTSSGKTFTLFGDDHTQGIVDHTIEAVYSRIMNSTDAEFLVKLTYAELYNEELKDLLTTAPSSTTEGGLKIVEDPMLGPSIQNVTEAVFINASQVKALLVEGENRRHFGVTNMNAHSSRSHVLVRLSIESRKVASKSTNSPLRISWNNDKPTYMSTLNLVDLAGSERASKSGTTGQSLKEGSFINKSLLTLGTVIANLSEGKQGIHIPYRNSKLTRLLSTALGGNAKTCMITCISPASGNTAESLSTLRFASRAKRVVNMVQQNEVQSMKSLNAKLASQTQEMEMLRAQLEKLRQLGMIPDDDYMNSKSPGALGWQSIKEKAIAISKSIRITRFLMLNGNIIVNKLRATGQTMLANKVKNTMHLALTGKRDLVEVLEEVTTCVQQHLVHDHRLMHLIQLLGEENDSERIVSNALVTSHDLYGSDYDPTAYRDLHDSSSCDFNDDMMMTLLFSSDEYRETTDQYLFANEDLRAEAVRTINGLVLKDKLSIKVIGEQQELLRDLNATIHKYQLNENSLNKQLEEVKKTWQQSTDKSNSTIQGLQSKIGHLEIQLCDLEAQIRSHQHTILSSQSESEKLKAQNEQLSRDLEASTSIRKSLEDDTSRSRNEMRVQMERLRANMHNMIMQGGQEAKVIEQHNIILQKSLDAANDALVLSTHSKNELEVDVLQLRSQIAVLRDEYKSYMNDVTALRTDNGDLTIKLRELRLENTKLSSTLTVSEQYCQKLVKDYTTEVRMKTEEYDNQCSEYKGTIHKLKLRISELTIASDRCEAELASYKNEMESKLLQITRLEHSLQADGIRFEKKHVLHNKMYDDMQHENATLKTQLHQLNRRYDEELKAARQKIGELQAVIDSINEHLLVHSEERDHIADEEDDDHHSLDDYHRMDSTDYTNASSHLPSLSASYRGESYGSQALLPSSSSSQSNGGTYLSLIFNTATSSSGSSTSDHHRYQQQQQYTDRIDDNDDLVLVLSDDMNTYDEYDASNLSTYNDDYDDNNGSCDDGDRDGANVEDKENTQALASDSKSQKSSSISRHNSQRSKNSVHFPFDDDSIIINNINSNIDNNNIGNINNNNNSSPDSRSSSFSPMKSTYSPTRSFLLSPSSRSTSFIVDQYERNIPSVQYTRLVQGIKLVTCMMSYLSKDELQVRNYLTQSQMSYREQMDIDNRTIQNLLDYQGHLEDNSKYLKSSMEFTKEMESKSSENYQLLDDDYQAMKVQYNHLLMKEQSMKGHDSKYEQMYQDIKVLYEKLKLEKKLCLDDHLDVSIKNMQLSSKIDDLEESNSVLQSQVELVKQDLGVIRIERDELMKHFLRQGSIIITNNNSNNNNNSDDGSVGDSNNVASISGEYKLNISYPSSGKSMEDYRRDVQQHLITGGGSSPTVPTINRAVVWTSPLRSSSSVVD